MTNNNNIIYTLQPGVTVDLKVNWITRRELGSNTVNDCLKVISVLHTMQQLLYFDCLLI